MYINDVIKNKNHPHIIILTKTNNFDIFDYLKITKKLITNNNIEYYTDDNKFLFNIQILKKDMNSYKKFINDIIHTNITNDHIYLYFYNYYNVSKNLQYYIKYVMENVSYVKVVIVCSSFNYIINAIKNQSFIIKNNTIDKNYKYYDTIINIIYSIYITCDFKSFITKIRNVVYNTFKYDVSIDFIINKFINRLLDKAYILNKYKIKLINRISTLEHKKSISNNQLIVYEYIFIEIYHIIKPSLNVYYNLI